MHTVPPQGHGMRVPLLGQQQPSQDQMKLQVMQAIGQLASAIYVQLAAGQIGSLDVHQELDEEKFRITARHCQTSAKAYFEGLGVIDHA